MANNTPLDSLTSPIKAVIYKKTLADGQTVYVPYLPRTTADWVSLNEQINIHGDTYAANSDLDTIVTALNNSIGAPTDGASSLPTASLQAQMNYVTSQLIAKSGAFVYKGSYPANTTYETPQQFCNRVFDNRGSGHAPLPLAIQPAAGWVFNISNNFKINPDNGKLIASTAGDAYKGGTNVVIIGSGTTGDPFKFDALGGDMGNHALTSQAIGSATLDGNTITFQYVNGTTASVVSFNTIGTTPVNTTTITGDISSASDNAIPNVGAVKAYAGSANNVIVTATSTSGTYHITFVGNTSDTGQPLYVDTSGLTYDPSTNQLDVIASQALAATTAGSVTQSLSVFNQSYNGSVAKTIEKGDGLTITRSGNTTTISVGGGDGIAVGTNGISVNKGAGLSFTDTGVLRVNVNASNTIEANNGGIGLTTTGIANGTYSAIQVDTYGRAKAGAQSIIFAAGPNDPDLNDLVVGGLAFIGTSSAVAGDYTSQAANASGTIGAIDDAE